MALKPEPLPIGTPLVDKQRFMDDAWVQYFNERLNEQLRAATVLPSGAVTLTEQNASIATATLEAANVTAGVYRISYQARITTPATTGAATSSLTVTLGWPDLGVSLTFSGAAMTGNTVTTFQSNTQLIYVDDGGPVTYATTYASDTAGQMKYVLRLALERISS